MTAFHTPTAKQFSSPSNFKAQRHHLEMIALDQDENLLVLCRLILDIQAVQAKLSRERYRLFVCADDEAPGSRKKGKHAKNHHYD